MREKTKTPQKETNSNPVPENLEGIKVPDGTKVSQEESKLICIDQKLVTAKARIHQLKKQREKLQSQQALLFFKETQKIFDKAFAPDLALIILKDAWLKASEVEREEWEKEGKPKRQLGTKTLQGENEKNQKEKREPICMDSLSEAGSPFRDFTASSSREKDPSSKPAHHPS